MIREWLEGKSIRHPVHPMLVHFPIGLWTLAVVLDIISFFVPEGNAVMRAAWYCMIFGVVLALLAAVPGLVDYTDIRRDHPGRRIALSHAVLNVTAVVIFVIALALRAAHLEAPSAPVASFVLNLIGLGIVGFSGYLGGMLVYDDGIGVGRHFRAGSTPEETIAVEGTPGSFLEVVSATVVRAQKAVRASVNGHVMTILHNADDDRFYAIQEFCTHRFGPLSEGSLGENQLQCPWHGSCFDVRTGAVTHGPAKVPVKTYEVEDREGILYVKA